MLWPEGPRSSGDAGDRGSEIGVAARMMTHRTDSVAQITFCPETQHMVIAFTGLPSSGLPPFSSELVDLALGAASVTFDLSAMTLTDPPATVEAILRTLGTDRDDPAVEIVLGDSEPGEALAGCYHAG